MLNKKYNITLLWVMAGLLALTFGCKKDKVSINRLPDITIGAVTITEKSIGDTVTITPTIGYGGQAATFSYKWYKYVYNANNSQVLKLVSQQPVFSMVMDSLGTYQLREEVTNVTTGVTASLISSWNVVSRAERGWYVLKATADGNTDMDAFLTSTRGAATTTNIITAKYGQTLSGSPVALAFTSVYNYLNPVTNKFVANNSCLMPMSSKEVLAYRIKDEKVLASSTQLFYEVPSASTRNYQALASDPNLMVLVNNGAVQGMNPASNSFLPARIGDYSLSPYFTMAPHLVSTDAGYVLGFDQKNESFVTVRYKQTDVTYFPNVYLNKPSSGAKQYNISPNNMGGKLAFMENMDGSLDTALTTNTRAYALLKKDNTSDMWLLGLNLAEIIPTVYNGAHSPIRYADTLLASKYPDITSASCYALNKNNPILYFTNGNKMGSYSIDSKTYTSNLYSFPANEEITYIKFIDCQYDTSTYNFTNLVVATYTNGSYKIYRFTVLGNTLVQTGTIFTGTGRVKTMIYTTPNTTPFFYSMYKYY